MTLLCCPAGLWHFLRARPSHRRTGDEADPSTDADAISLDLASAHLCDAGRMPTEDPLSQSPPIEGPFSRSAPLGPWVWLQSWPLTAPRTDKSKRAIGTQPPPKVPCRRVVRLDLDSTKTPVVPDRLSSNALHDTTTVGGVRNSPIVRGSLDQSAQRKFTGSLQTERNPSIIARVVGLCTALDRDFLRANEFCNVSCSNPRRLQGHTNTSVEDARADPS